MGKEKTRQADELDALLARYEAKKAAAEAKKEREDLTKALKQLVLHLCWLQQVTKKRFEESIPFFICRYCEEYAKGDKALLGEVMDFFNDDCRQGARRIELNYFRPDIIQTKSKKELIICCEDFKMLDELLGEESAKNEDETKEQGGEVNATERI